MGEYGDHRLVGGAANGYIIYEGHIAGAGRGWKWRAYTGPNAHKHHLHVSVCSNPAGYDDGSSPWHIADLFTPQPPAADLLEAEDVPCIINPINDQGAATSSPSTSWPATGCRR